MTMITTRSSAWHSRASASRATPAPGLPFAAAYIGECFESVVSRAFTTKEQALALLQLPPTAVPPTRDGGDDSSPLNDTALDREDSVRMRAYPGSWTGIDYAIKNNREEIVVEWWCEATH
jgi:hypothetical protein